MSNIYIQEPPTSGKVLLVTSVGDIDIELWSKECPLACRNFIQLCMEGYYNGTKFHRIVKGFIAQGGDPNEDGTGGESVFGRPFKDEFHSRLRYVRRGLVGMANSGKNDNGSQFFFTLGPTPELQNQNTLFGKVAGETIYNMLKLEEGEIFENERPHYAHRIIKTEVLSNPFDDIVPRQLTKDGHKSKSDDNRSTSKRKKEKGVKNFGLLSFGDEAEEEEMQTKVFVTTSGRGKSSHDVLDDPNLSKETSSTNHLAGVAKPQTMPESGTEESAETDNEDNEHKKGSSTSQNDALRKNVREKLTRKSASKRPKIEPVESESDSDDGLDSGNKKSKREQAERIREEINKLKKDYHTDKRRAKELTDKQHQTVKRTNPTARKEAMEEVIKVQQQYSQKISQLPKKGNSRESHTMELLQKFKSKLRSAYDSQNEVHPGGSNDAAVDEDEEIRGDKWLAHRLEFNKQDDPILAKDAATKGDDWYDVYDPRNPLNKRKRGEQNERSHKHAK
ncbi:spliceosome-associated protein CWC27 homolog [Anopheles nili]|uniref:spliceosome-associated protein CWC27 homolog n=1 Tax=Anopheles nili TaxID=185578 RepID=UPI00237A6F84|nr:spliceosome-associated protein CWC27 homolog [Anopheles nili]